MSTDQYSSFDQLFDREKRGTDYDIVVVPRDLNFLIMAPHGGEIETRTSEIARRVAGDDISLYLFEGLRKRKHSDLHITSHKYDEPQALDIVKKCEVVVAIHGRQDGDDSETVWLGGLDVETRRKIEEELKRAGFRAAVEAEKLPATHPSNICNRGSKAKGVQLEIPWSLREELHTNPARLDLFSDAIRKAILSERE